jgi:hypothetical protein
MIDWVLKGWRVDDGDDEDDGWEDPKKGTELGLKETVDDDDEEE